MVTMAKTDVLHEWKHDSVAAARKEIFAAIGDVSGVLIAGSQVLIGCYLRPSIKKLGTAGRELIIPGQTVMEDQWQGKVAIIVKFGEAAIPAPDDPHRATFLRNWGGRDPEVGDFVFMDVKQGFQLSLCGLGGVIHEDRKKGGDWAERGWPCRLIYIKDLFGIVSDPSMIV